MHRKAICFVLAAIAGTGPLMISSGSYAADKGTVANVRQMGVDVTLQGNVFSGQFVTTQGAAVAGATVTISQRGQEVARTVTNAEGQFSTALRPGIYDVVVGSERETVRVWSSDSAPPTARPAATFVAGDVVRGQLEEIDFTALTAATIFGTALTIGITELDGSDVSN